MSYNPNAGIDTAVCKGIERLYDALKRKGIVLKGIELSKPLVLFGKEQSRISLTFGPHFNRRHIKIAVPKHPNTGEKEL